ncbi:MAG: KpsF/GutQ family sugar-phosphate isomerase [Planktomarina sp.]
MTNLTHMETARRVIRTEADALGALADHLDDGFDRAVDLILNAKGRVIVSGMGKSGHIARKIAATLASTGTPAHFVHPAEASHGDLGMMTTGDVVLVLSNSGETPELADLIAHTRRYQIPMIGIAMKAASNLIVQADIGITLPKVEEACQTGVVPTTSTTMALALGDALAVALMDHRQFTASQFRNFHPGGKLGARLSKVANLMHPSTELPLISPDQAMSDTLLMMTAKGFGVAGVVQQERLIGIVTDGDLRRNLDGLLDRTTADVMSRDPLTISPDALAERALGEMNKRKITSLFVTHKDRKVLGLIHIHDCLRAGLG